MTILHLIYNIANPDFQRDRLLLHHCFVCHQQRMHNWEVYVCLESPIFPYDACKLFCSSFLFLFQLPFLLNLENPINLWYAESFIFKKSQKSRLYSIHTKQTNKTDGQFNEFQFFVIFTLLTFAKNYSDHTCWYDIPFHAGDCFVLKMYFITNYCRIGYTDLEKNHNILALLIGESEILLTRQQGGIAWLKK